MSLKQNLYGGDRPFLANKQKIRIINFYKLFFIYISTISKNFYGYQNFIKTVSKMSQNYAEHYFQELY